jgi:hypothetical protein
MTKARTIGLWVGTLGLVGGCSSGGGGSAASPCPITSPEFICNPSGFAFVSTALVGSDACNGPVAFCPIDGGPLAGATTAHLSHPEPGKVCMSGTVSTFGWAQIGLGFTVDNATGTQVLKTFNANAMGITQMAFTIDSPPSGGVTVDAAITTSLVCPDSGADCFTYGFTLMTAPLSNIPLSITTPGPVVAPFINFEQTRAGVTQTFDTSALDHVVFDVGAGDFDFCVRDFKFLDANGVEVKP